MENNCHAVLLWGVLPSAVLHGNNLTTKLGWLRLRLMQVDPTTYQRLGLLLAQNPAAGTILPFAEVGQALSTYTQFSVDEMDATRQTPSLQPSLHPGTQERLLMCASNVLGYGEPCKAAFVSWPRRENAEGPEGGRLANLSELAIARAPQKVVAPLTRVL